MAPLVMGVLNVTPDSFSDGGRYLDPEAAVTHGLQMVEDGADVVDVGGESSRPGATPVPEEEELRRVLPVIEALSGSVRVSVDTAKAGVAEAAAEAGATLINDTTARLQDVAASTGTGWVAMHMQGTPRDMQLRPHYRDVVSEVRAFLEERAERGRRAGVQEIWVDPGIGFGKTPEHNLQLLAGLGELARSGLPVLVGTSRKSFLGLLAGSAPQPGGTAGVPGRRGAEVDDRLEASLATAVWAMASGAAMVRVHDVAETVQAARITGPGTPRRLGAGAGRSPT